MSGRVLSNYRDVFRTLGTRKGQVSARPRKLLTKETLDSINRIGALIIVCGALGILAHKKTTQGAIADFLSEHQPSLKLWDNTLASADWHEWRKIESGLKTQLSLPFTRETPVLYVDRKNALFYLVRPEGPILYFRGSVEPKGVVAPEWEELGKSWVAFEGLENVIPQFPRLETVTLGKKKAKLEPLDLKAIVY
ncbi:MAG: hypothetical protein EOP09_07540 [Proteobacteria bacterium]|nr:MAG: hypothetical protein EOP09_07540 [Pseudomonadota bacterium]